MVASAACGWSGVFWPLKQRGAMPCVPLRILDIGSGSCDIPLAVSRWARAHGIPLHFTCLEMAGHAVDIARAQLARAGNPAVQLLQEDVFTHQPVEPYDCAVASMCFHHFSNDTDPHAAAEAPGFCAQQRADQRSPALATGFSGGRAAAGRHRCAGRGPA